MSAELPSDVPPGVEQLRRELESTRRALEMMRAGDAECYQVAPVACFLVDLSGVIQRANGAACEMLGYAAQELLGMDWDEVVLPEDLAAWGTVERDAARDSIGVGVAPVASVQLRLKAKKGEPIGVELRAKRSATDAGPTWHLVAIDDRRPLPADSRLSETVRLLEMAGEMARVGVWELNLATGDVRYSKETARLHEIDFETAGEHLSRAQDYYPPDAWPAVASAVRSAIEHGIPYEFVSPFITAKGRRLWVRVQGFPVKEGDAVVRLCGTFQDITEQKLIEEALRSSNADLRAILDAIPDLLFEVGESGHIYGYHSHRSNLLAAPPEAFLGKNIREVLPPATAAVGEQAIREASAHGWSLGATYALSLPDREAWFELSVAAKRQQGSGEPRFVVLTRDITARKAAEAQLVASEARFRAIAEACPVPMLLCEASGRITLLNPAFVRTFGYGLQDISSSEDWWAQLLPDPAYRQTLCDSWKREFARACESNTPFVPQEMQLRCRDGRELTVLVSAARVPDVAGDTQLRMLYDITERKQAEQQLRASEERFRQLTENIEDVFWISDVEKDKIIYVSPGYESIWGRSCEALYGSPRTWLDAIHPDDRERVREAAETKQALGLYHETYRIQRPDGTMRWISDKASPVIGQDGKVSRIVGTARDVTAQVELEERLHQAQKLQAVGSLTAGIAHDVGSIVGAILAHVDLATRWLPAEHPARNNLTRIAEASHLAKRLVEQLLTFSRHRPMARRIVALAPLLEDGLKLLRATIPSTIQLETSLAPDAAPVLADAIQLQQVLINLCTNAYQACSGSLGRITIGLENVTLDAAGAKRFPELQSGSFVRLSVSDDGCGMTAAVRERLFEPFFTTKPGKGTGLGLSVVHGIVKAHDGVIEVISEAGVGSTFALYFPAATIDQVEAAPKQEEPADPATAKEDPGVGTGGRGETILLVEDQAVLREALTVVLRSEGYQVLEADTPARAESIAKTHGLPIQLLVTDVVMPGMTGVELARALRAARPGLKVLFLSGYPADVVTQKGWLDDGTPYLAKPCPMPLLCQEMRRLLAT